RRRREVVPCERTYRRIVMREWNPRTTLASASTGYTTVSSAHALGRPAGASRDRFGRRTSSRRVGDAIADLGPVFGTRLDACGAGLIDPPHDRSGRLAGLLALVVGLATVVVSRRARAL